MATAYAHNTRVSICVCLHVDLACPFCVSIYRCLCKWQLGMPTVCVCTHCSMMNDTPGWMLMATCIHRDHCNILQHAASRCNTLQRHTPGRMLMATWTHRDTAALVCSHPVNPDLTRKEIKLLSKISKYYHLPGICCNVATYCNTLQHTATHCNTLQHYPPIYTLLSSIRCMLQHCNTLQHAATCCSTLRQTSTPGNTTRRCMSHGTHMCQSPYAHV